MANIGEVKNKQVIFRDYVRGFPKESDFIITSATIRLKLPQGSNGVLLKTLYLSCDPYMRLLMESQSAPTSYSPGSVIYLSLVNYFTFQISACINHSAPFHTFFSWL